jgi:branched-chain amino acid transport system permease protein
VAAGLRSLSIGIAVGVVMGVSTVVVERYLPSNSQFTAAVIPSIPFLCLLLFLIYFAVVGGNAQETELLGSALDRSLAPHGGASQEAMASAPRVVGAPVAGVMKAIPIGFFVFVCLLAVFLSGVWVAALGVGVAYAVVFLSYTVGAGEGGMIWLCQITFAGIGAFTTAELATHEGWPVVAGMIAGGLICAILGALIGILTIRLGDLHIALVTLTFGLLVENLVFGLKPLNNSGAGVPIALPHYLQQYRNFDWFALAAYALLAFAYVTLRRSTFGLAVKAVRWSEEAARATGLSVLRTKVALSAFAAFVAGVGGGLLALYAEGAFPGSYSTFLGLTWLAVVVAVGIRSASAALLAGLSFGFIPELFASYLPTSWGNVPPALFGLGAVMVARNPGGVVLLHARQVETLLSRVVHPRGFPAVDSSRDVGATGVPGGPSADEMEADGRALELGSGNSRAGWTRP